MLQRSETPDETSAPSAIPRFSRLPQRASRAQSIKDSAGPAIPTSSESALFSPPRRTGLAYDRPSSAVQDRRDVTSPKKNTNGPMVNNGGRQNTLVRPGFQSGLPAKPAVQAAPTQSTGPPSISSSTSPKSLQDSGEETRSPTETGPVGGAAIETPVQATRAQRPSLSDRTMETLAQIPPSPSPARRRSGFFVAESPQPPSRAASALGHARPASRSGIVYPSSRLPAAGGASKLPSITSPPSATKPTAAASGRRRPMSFIGPPSSTGASYKNAGPTVANTSSRLQRPKVSPLLTDSSNTLATNGRKLPASRLSPKKSPVKGLFAEDISPAQATVEVAKTSGLAKPRPKGHVKQSSIATSKSLGLKSPVDLKSSRIGDHARDVDEQPHTPRKGVASSKGLRDAIAMAKAAHRNSPNRPAGIFMPNPIEDDNNSIIAMNTPEKQSHDPVTSDALDSSHFNILRKRIHNAKVDGKLNIAALCLTDIPVEVLRMYDFDPNAEGGPAWYETVDVTRLNAADNEIGQLPESVFKSSSQKSSLGGIPDEDTPNGIFVGLEAMDLHGNQLKMVPDSLSGLHRLTVLNLSRNKLSMESFRTITRIGSLRELRMSENSLDGPLAESIGDLENLETLDVRRNKLNEVPAGLGRLSKLRVLNLDSNRLSSLPFEAIFDLPLTEISASDNRLSGSLLPASIPLVPTIQTLDVSRNTLTAFAEGKIEFPQLQALNISHNKVSALPDVSLWHKLITLNAEENKISELPQGFSALVCLKIANFASNSLLQLDEGVASMDNLVSLDITSNPLRQRKLLKMDIEDVKAELRSLKELQSPASEHNTVPQHTAENLSAWPVSGHTLDRSSTRLKAIENSDLTPLEADGITNALLHHNQLTSFPVSLGILGSTLATLDLSNNKVGKLENYLAEELSLPHLHTLNLTSNALTTLDPLMTHLSAPNLTNLILLFNRITVLPRLRSAFPQLTKLMAPNNKLTRLDVESIRGLQVLDISSNDIEELPPQLGLLKGELRTLIINANKFRVPSWSTLEKGTDAVLDWCRQKLPESLLKEQEPENVF